MNNNLRKVVFNKWIPKVEEKQSYGSTTKVGTGCWETEFKNEGLFHQWGYAYEESSEGFGNYTVAIVELQDGTVIEVLPSNVKFIKHT